VAATTADLFHVLSARPLRGRTLLPDDDRSKRDVAVISEGMWTQRFARRETAIGERLVLDGRALTIIGVMPASFDFPIQGDRIQAWVPLTAVDLPSQFVATRGAHFLTIVARLSPQATVAQANAELAAVTTRLATEYPQSNAGRSAHAYALQERVVGDYHSHYSSWSAPSVPFCSSPAATWRTCCWSGGPRGSARWPSDRR